ncbi:hypothetical protein BH09CHL1_BH09CHL1_13700 [soil metagenome]
MSSVLDYPRSFVTFFTNPSQGGNIARIQLDATCRVEGWNADGESELFHLIAPCRSEHMYLDGQLFQMPNYEFCGIFTSDRVSLIRTHWTSEHEKSDIQAVSDRFERVALDRTELAAELLPNVDAIVAATLSNRLLVVRTMLRDEATGVAAVLEYPIKTMNVTRDPLRFQVDTGPIIVPLFDSTLEPIGRFAIAHAVYWQEDRVEFILRKPHAVSGTQVTDYSELSFHAASHEVWAEVR